MYYIFEVSSFLLHPNFFLLRHAQQRKRSRAMWCENKSDQEGSGMHTGEKPRRFSLAFFGSKTLKLPQTLGVGCCRKRHLCSIASISSFRGLSTALSNKIIPYVYKSWWSSILVCDKIAFLILSHSFPAPRFSSLTVILILNNNWKRVLGMGFVTI